MFLGLWLCLVPVMSVSAAPTTVLVLGDSLTAGYGLAPEDAFPVRLEAQLARRGHAVNIVNAGISGDTSSGGLARLEWSLTDRPDVVIIELGANDALRGLPSEQTRNNLAAIIERLKQDNIKVLLTGMKAPRNLGEQYYTSFDALYPSLAEQFRVAFYPFFLDGVAGVVELNQDDGIHPNADGVAVIVKRIIPYLEPLLSPQ